MDASMKDAYQAKVRKVLYEFKNKTLKSGKKKVTNRKQAIAIALSKAAHLKKKGK
jgi:hypothetical protein